MPAFARSFLTQKLAVWDKAHPENAVRALFDRWALPGYAVTDDMLLRLGVRDGYLNFYIKGQSTAKLSFGRNGPHLLVHEAYVEGRRCDPQEGASGGQSYSRYDAAWLAESSNSALIPGWIETALTYSSAEKRFVDDLVAANAGVIDLEMGLPASDLPESPRVAPRMDLVVTEIVDGAASIVFWEAKCATNGELRSSRDYVRLDGGSFTGPKVLHQLSKYSAWMSEPNRPEQVRSAYKSTASVLLDLYGTFAPPASKAPACVGVWQALAQTTEPMLYPLPGLVIGNYWPDDYTDSIASGRMGQSARSFARKGHREKLENEGIRVHEVDSAGDPAVLPRLAEAMAA